MIRDQPRCQRGYAAARDADQARPDITRSVHDLLLRDDSGNSRPRLVGRVERDCAYPKGVVRDEKLHISECVRAHATYIAFLVLEHALDVTDRFVLAILDWQMLDDGLEGRRAGFGNGDVEEGVRVERRSEKVECLRHGVAVTQMRL